MMTLKQALADEIRGHTRLWVVFWVYGVLVSQLSFGGIVYFYRQLPTPALAAALLAFLVYTAWIMRAVWVNAFNVDKEVYGHVARFLTVAWSLNAVMVCAFLFLGHLGAISLPF